MTQSKYLHKVKTSTEDRVFVAIIVAIAVILVAVTAYPLVYVLSASFSDPLDVMNGSLVLFPHKVTTAAYKAVLVSDDILIGYKNTIKYTFLGTFINLLMTTIAAYPLSRKDMKGKGLITAFITFTMFFNGGMIPTFITIKNLHLLDTVWAMVLPNAIGVTNLLIMKNFFEYSVPEDLIEAAFIDGCSNVRTLFSIVLPVSKSIIGVLVVYYFVGHWNSYFDALLYLSSRNKYSLQVFLRQLLIQNSLEQVGGGDSATELALLAETMKYAVIVLASVPAMVIYPIMQRFFTKGIMIGAVKG